MEQQAYEKLLAEHKLTVGELPKDAQIGIKAITDIKKAIHLATSTGKNIKPSVYERLKANDKWVVREILDFIEEKNTNTEPLPNPSAAVIADIKEPEPQKVPMVKDGDKISDTVAEPTNSAEGEKVDAELDAIFKTGKTSLTLEEVKSLAKTTYGILFDSYTAGTENGVETDKFALLEAEKEVFTLTKK